MAGGISYEKEANKYVDKIISQTPDKKTSNEVKSSSGSMEENTTPTSSNSNIIADSDLLRDVPKSQTDNVTNIIGLPPQWFMSQTGGEVNYSQIWVTSTMPVCRITPVYPSINEGEQSHGLHLFSVSIGKGRIKYQKVLDSCGLFKTSNTSDSGPTQQSSSLKESDYNQLDVAYLNETSMTETWSAEYGNSRFEDMGNMGGSMMGEARYITGAKTGKEALLEMGNTSRGLPGIGGIAEWGLDTAAGMFGASEKVLSNWGMAGLLSGSRVDFPQIWKNASYNTGYSITVRLYNPNPVSQQDYETFILKPLAKILAFIIPITDDPPPGSTAAPITYNAPVLCNVKCSGLWQIRAGFVSSIEVIKGGEANDISWIQRPNMIDVRISFGELYGVMTTATAGIADRQSLKGYIDILQGRSIPTTVIMKDYGMEAPEAPIDWTKLGTDLAKSLLPTFPTSKLPGYETVNRIGNNLKTESDKLKDSEFVKGAVQKAQNIQDSAEGLVADMNLQSFKNDKSTKAWGKIKGATKKTLKKETDQEVKRISQTCDPDTITGRLWDSGMGSLADTVSSVSLDYTKNGLELKGTQSFGQAGSNFSNSMTNSAKSSYQKSTGAMMKAPGRVTGDSSNTLTNWMRGTQPPKFAQAVKEGKQHITGPQPIEVVQATLNTCREFDDGLKGVLKYGTIAGGDEDAVLIMAETVTGLPINIVRDSYGNFSSYNFSGTTNEFTGLTEVDLLNGSLDMLDDTISNLSINAWLSFPRSLKNSIDSLTGGMISALSTLIRTYDNYVLSSTELDYYKHEDAKNNWKVVMADINGGFKGDLAGSKCLMDVLAATEGRMDVSYDYGIFDGLYDAFEIQRNYNDNLANGDTENTWPYIKDQVIASPLISPSDKAFIISEIDININMCNNAVITLQGFMDGILFIKENISTSRLQPKTFGN